MDNFSRLGEDSALFQEVVDVIDRIDNPAILLRLHNQIIDKLRREGVIRTSNNPTADYAEHIAADCLGLKLQKNSNKGYDGIDKNGHKYQVKSRHLTEENTSKELGAVADLINKEFDYLIVLIFNKNWTVHTAAKLTCEAFKRLAREKKKGHVLIWNEKMINEAGVENLIGSFS